MTIQNIWAVGRNYQDHAKEMGSEVPKSPMIFLKAGSTAVHEGGVIHLPSFSKDVQHEVEVAYQFDKNLNLTKATIALDLTARDIQSQLKAAGHPWTLAKSFKDSCALGEFFNISSPDEILEFELRVNKIVRQSGMTSSMVFPVSALARYVRECFPVVPGDVLLTGTPAGVSPLKRGDVLEAEIRGKIKALWTVA